MIGRYNTIVLCNWLQSDLVWYEDLQATRHTTQTEIEQ